MSPQNLRMSRITHPRASIWGAVLLVTVFFSIGAVAAACLPEQTPTSQQTQSNPSATQASRSLSRGRQQGI